MKKPNTTTATAAESNPWAESTTDSAIETQAIAPETAETKITVTKSIPVEPLFDMEGLMTDFPTATELERFVYDQTGIVLNLKGRANKLKYTVAMDVLNQQPVDPIFIGTDNPYLDRADLVPEEPMRQVPARDPRLPDASELQNSFYSPFVPHPDPEYRGRGKKCHVVFRKYKTGAISYEVLGPIDQYTEGTKIDKYGRERPEIIRYKDPRTGEQMVQNNDGTLTNIGKRMKPMMQTLKINQTSHWDVWIDRSFGSMNRDVRSNPWLD